MCSILLYRVLFISDHFFRGKFFQIPRARVGQIPRLTTANLEILKLIFCGLLNVTEYAVFFAGKLLQLTDRFCLPN